MIKGLFFCALVSVLVGCTGESSKLKANNERNSISVITDDALWNGPIGDSIRKGLTQPVMGLMYEEPQFSLNQYPAVLFEDFTGKNRHLLLVKYGSPAGFLTANSSEVEGQTIYELQAPTDHELAILWQEIAPSLRKHIEEAEWSNVLSEMHSKPLHENAGLSAHPFVFRFPTEFNLNKEAPNFKWYKKEIVSGSASFLFYSIPYQEVNEPYELIAEFIQQRDSITSQYIIGAMEKSPMLVEDAFSPQIFPFEWNNQEAMILKGSWEMRNNFMNGPFIAYILPDPAQGVYWVAEGFCYTPTRKKRDILTELEAVLWSAKPAIKSK